MPMALPNLNLNRASLSTYASFFIGVYGVVGEMKKPTKDIAAMSFYIGLMGVPVVFPGAKPPKEKNGNGGN